MQRAASVLDAGTAADLLERWAERSAELAAAAQQ
jgi:hypothetical protein